MSETFKIKSLASQEEVSARMEAARLLEENPVPDNEKIANIGLFVKRQELTKTLFFAELYKQVLQVHGSIFEFGVRWGQNLVTLNNLRGIYEPFNHSRKIVGFDTFEGFVGTHEKDGGHDVISSGSLAVSEGYEEYLQRVLKYHEQECPLSHISKNSLEKGDAPKRLADYLQRNPETIVAMAWFDMTLYEPTYECLKQLKGHLTKGSILGFDELNDHQFPGETIALRDALGLENVAIQRNQFSGAQSYVVID